MGLFVTCGSQELLDSLIIKYKRGKYLQGIIKKAIEENSQSKSSLKQALAFKYQNFLSWRKFNLMCKTQSSVFDPNAEVWLPRNVKCLGVDVDVSINKILDEKLEKCVKSLDIGSINQIPNVPGVSRTITGLVFMIMDLHLQLPHLCWQLTWFNENNNHFIFQFSDDGTPETSQLTMSIGSLTLWNLGEQVRSREFQYLLHCISLGEKHKMLELLGKQHSDEMQLLESNFVSVCGKQCTLEFQPSADMSWQSWACNELNQAAKYPSPYANVQKNKLCVLDGTIGHKPQDTWVPYTNDLRKEHLQTLNNFLNSLPSTLSSNTRHDKMLTFMADNHYYDYDYDYYYDYYDYDYHYHYHV